MRRASALAMMATGVMLVACGNQTPEQQAAGFRAAAEGLGCIGAVGAAVMPDARGDASDGEKALMAAADAGKATANDSRCSQAIVDGASAMPTK